jgi:hypothetical protein
MAKGVYKEPKTIVGPRIVTLTLSFIWNGKGSHPSAWDWADAVDYNFNGEVVKTDNIGVSHWRETKIPSGKRSA